MRPNYLKNGDKVALIATAKKIDQGQLDGAIGEIESWGLQVVSGSYLYAIDRQFAGTDEQRASYLQSSIDNDKIKAVLFARGGYGTARIIDLIDWSHFSKNPKWLCGFSDLTVLHSHISRHLNIETLHSTMPIFFKDGIKNEGSESLRKALFGEHKSIEWKGNALNREGQAEGQIIGGNLSVLYSITGTTSQPIYDGKILFLEDLTENLYHLDRMMMQFKRAGHLSKLKGLIVGQFTEMEDNAIPFGKSAEEIILDAVNDFNYPVAFNAPIGHVDHNEAVFCGREVRLSLNSAQSIISF